MFLLGVRAEPGMLEPGWGVSASLGGWKDGLLC